MAKKKRPKEVEQSLYLEAMGDTGLITPDGMSSEGDGKDKNLFRLLEMRVTFDTEQGQCSRCRASMGVTSYSTNDGPVCASCASDIKKGRDTREAWWRK